MDEASLHFKVSEEEKHEVKRKEKLRHGRRKKHKKEERKEGKDKGLKKRHGHKEKSKDAKDNDDKDQKRHREKRNSGEEKKRRHKIESEADKDAKKDKDRHRDKGKEKNKHKHDKGKSKKHHTDDDHEKKRKKKKKIKKKNHRKKAKEEEVCPGIPRFLDYSLDLSTLTKEEQKALRRVIKRDEAEIRALDQRVRENKPFPPVLVFSGCGSIQALREVFQKGYQSPPPDELAEARARVENFCRPHGATPLPTALPGIPEDMLEQRKLDTKSGSSCYMPLCNPMLNSSGDVSPHDLFSIVRTEIDTIRHLSHGNGSGTGWGATCSRCNKDFGGWNSLMPYVFRGVRCMMCHYRVCNECRVQQPNGLFLCRLCLRYREEKQLTGEWVGTQHSGVHSTDLLKLSFKDKKYFERKRKVDEKLKEQQVEKLKVELLEGARRNRHTKRGKLQGANKEKKRRGCRQYMKDKRCGDTDMLPETNVPPAEINFSSKPMGNEGLILTARNSVVQWEEQGESGSFESFEKQERHQIQNNHKVNAADSGVVANYADSISDSNKINENKMKENRTTSFLESGNISAEMSIVELSQNDALRRTGENVSAPRQFEESLRSSELRCLPGLQGVEPSVEFSNTGVGVETSPHLDNLHPPADIASEQSLQPPPYQAHRFPERPGFECFPPVKSEGLISTDNEWKKSWLLDYPMVEAIPLSHKEIGVGDCSVRRPSLWKRISAPVIQAMAAILRDGSLRRRRRWWQRNSSSKNARTTLDSKDVVAPLKDSNFPKGRKEQHSCTKIDEKVDCDEQNAEESEEESWDETGFLAESHYMGDKEFDLKSPTSIVDERDEEKLQDETGNAFESPFPLFQDYNWNFHPRGRGQVPAYFQPPPPMYGTRSRGVPWSMVRGRGGYGAYGPGYGGYGPRGSRRGMMRGLSRGRGVRKTLSGTQRGSNKWRKAAKRIKKGGKHKSKRGKESQDEDGTESSEKNETVDNSKVSTEEVGKKVKSRSKVSSINGESEESTIHV